MKKYLILDTETRSLSQRHIYDIGWVIMNESGEIVKKRSYFIKQEERGFSTAYYHEKNNKYYKSKLESKEMKKVYLGQALRWLVKDSKECELWAYNSPFDMVALQRTSEKYNKELNIGQINDIMRLTRNLKNDLAYKAWCIEHNALTNHKRPQPRINAETVYRYLSGLHDFEESHTALEDAIIEAFILKNMLG